MALVIPATHRTIQTVMSRQGEILAVVEHIDGSYGLSINGHEANALRWNHNQLDDCLWAMYVVAGHNPPADLRLHHLNTQHQLTFRHARVI
jgi:hypothetical protein